MRRLLPSILATTVATALAATLAPHTALADAQGTAPKLVVDDTPMFIVGKAISLSEGSSAGEPAFPDWTTVPVAQKWRATAPEGIHHYEADIIDDDWFETTWTNIGLSTRSDYTTSDYNGDYGGGGYSHQWHIKAVDNNGDEATKLQRSWEMKVIQEDGGSPSYWPVGDIAYSGTWGTSNCECFSGGGWEYDYGTDVGTYHIPQTRFTKVKAAAVTYKATFERGDHFGIVMPMSSSRGKASIVINGAVVATVDTYSKTTKNRMVMWQKWMPAGVHTIKVVNLATAGHPRIDIDAFLHNG